MTDLLVYWRDYLRNRTDAASDSDLRHWHSSSRLIGDLQRRDRLWLVSSGRATGQHPEHHGFLVEVWTVESVERNSGNVPDYPSDRYQFRVTAQVDRNFEVQRPIDVDAMIRPGRSSVDIAIGRLLQGPRRLTLGRVEQLLSVVAGAPQATGDIKSSFSPHPAKLDPDVLALGIRQPWAELILRGHKTIEVRTVAAKPGRTIYLYASNRLADVPAANRAMSRFSIDPETLPRGRIVGSVEISNCRPCRRSDADRACVPASLLADRYAWELSLPQRIEPPVRPRFTPYGMWFYPFRRRNDG